MLVDESGVDEMPKQSKKYAMEDNWFTNACVIIKDIDIQRFNAAYDSIIQQYFTSKSIKLPDNFKLCYH